MAECRKWRMQKIPNAENGGMQKVPNAENGGMQKVPKILKAPKAPKHEIDKIYN